MSKTYDEIKDQYAALRKTFQYMESKKAEIIKFWMQKKPKSLAYIGCGSGYCLCRSGELSARLRLGLPATAFAAGDLMLNYKEYLKLLEGGMIIAASRSGSTTEVIRAIENVKSEVDTPVLAVTCAADSQLSRIADLALELPWAFDGSVCQTRTVVNLYTANLLILAYASGDTKLTEDIEKVIETGSRYMEKYEEVLKNVAAAGWSKAVVLADGELQGIAEEGALAFTEIAMAPGNYHHLLDVRHGPAVLVGEDTIVIACLTDKEFAYQKALITDLLKKGAKVVVYSSRSVEEIEGVSLQVSSDLELDSAVRGIPFIYIPQVLAYYKAVNTGKNPDSPIGLEPWIKL